MNKREGKISPICCCQMWMPGSRECIQRRKPFNLVTIVRALKSRVDSLSTCDSVTSNMTGLKT